MMRFFIRILKKLKNFKNLKKELKIKILIKMQMCKSEKWLEMRWVWPTKIES